LTEDQLRAWSGRVKRKKLMGKSRRTPGYLGCQDTYYVGNIKGWTNLPQNLYRFYSKVTLANSTSKHAITAADMLNDRVLPWSKTGGHLLRILTDRGSEFSATASVTNMRSIWIWKTSNTAAPKLNHPNKRHL